jgi:hypothetical protein
MYVGGAYITYSELFDRKPSWAEVEEIFAPLNLVHTTILLLDKHSPSPWISEALDPRDEKQIVDSLSPVSPAAIRWE